MRRSIFDIISRVQWAVAVTAGLVLLIMIFIIMGRDIARGGQ